MPNSWMARLASPMALSPLKGSTAAQDWMMRSGWRFCMPETKSFEQGGVDDRGFQVERHQNRFDSRVREILHDFLSSVFATQDAIPIFGQRVHIGLLAGDPFLGVWVAVNVDDSHRFPCRREAGRLGRRSVLFLCFCRHFRRDHLDELLLRNFAECGQRKIRQNFEPLGEFEFRDLFGRSGNAFSSSKRTGSRHRAAITQAHMRSPISGSGTGNAGHIFYRRMRENQVLDFFGADFFAAAVD